MKRYKLNLTNNPSFNTVVGLANRTFDGTTIVQGRGATEDQLLVVYNKIKEVADFIEESGCSGDPFALIKQQLDQLEQAQAECCGTDWSAVVTQSMFERMAGLEDRIEECCTVDHGAVDIQNLLNRLDALEQQIIDCCNKSCLPDTAPAGCDGNVITVSFSWNGSNPFSDGGQASAVSGDTSRSIVGFYFLAYNPDTGLYYKRSDANGGDWTWSINSSGAVTASHTGAGGTLAFAHTIVAVDNSGCEGMTTVTLPKSFSVGG